MKKYSDVLDALEQGAEREYISSEIMTWDEEGQSLIGEVLDWEEFGATQFDTTCNKYYINTDDGPVSCILGGAADKQIAPKLRKHMIIYIIFRGQKQLKNNKMVNVFTILDVTKTYEGLGKKSSKKS